MTSAPDRPAPGRRRPTLDALRGVAAVVVLAHHCALVYPPLSAVYLAGSRPTGVIQRWVAVSPLRLLWAGDLAVLVFFVLSGVVLALPSVQHRQAPWRAYFPQRLLRLYLPIIGSVAAAVGWALLVPRVADPSGWVSNHVASLTADEVLRGVSVVAGTGWLNSVLWSLQWEVVFSLLLPLLVALLLHRRVPVLLVAVVLLAVVGWSAYLPFQPTWAPASAAAFYLPLFALGLLAVRQEAAIRRLMERTLASRPIRAGVWALVLGLLWLAEVSASGVPAAQRVALAVGCLTLVALVGFGPGSTRTTVHPVLGWLGSRSFSLYLVHEPIVVSVALLMDRLGLVGGARLAATAGLGVPLALVATEVFFRVIESPAHRAARRIGARLGGSSARASAVVGVG